MGYITDWRQTGGDAKDLFVGTLDAYLTSSSTIMRGITLNNQGFDDVIIDTLSLQWGGDALLYSIDIATTTVYDVLPENGVGSGGVVDISDYILLVSSGTTSIENISFDSAIVGNNVTMTVVASDGSTHHSLIEF